MGLANSGWSRSAGWCTGWCTGPPAPRSRCWSPKGAVAWPGNVADSCPGSGSARAGDGGAATGGIARACRPRCTRWSMLKRPAPVAASMSSHAAITPTSSHPPSWANRPWEMCTNAAAPIITRMCRATTTRVNAPRSNSPADELDNRHERCRHDRQRDPHGLEPSVGATDPLDHKLLPAVGEQHHTQHEPADQQRDIATEQRSDTRERNTSGNTFQETSSVLRDDTHPSAVTVAGHAATFDLDGGELEVGGRGLHVLV